MKKNKYSKQQVYSTISPSYEWKISNPIFSTPPKEKTMENEENKENKSEYQGKYQGKCNIDIELEQNDRIIFGKVNHVDSRLFQYKDDNGVLAESNEYNIISIFYPEIINNGKTLMVWGSNTEKNHFPLYYRYNFKKDAYIAFDEFNKLIDKINSQNLDCPVVPCIPNKIVGNIVINFSKEVCYQDKLTADDSTNLERVTFDWVKRIYTEIYNETKNDITLKQKIKIFNGTDQLDHIWYPVKVISRTAYISMGCLNNISIEIVQEIYSQIINFEKSNEG